MVNAIDFQERWVDIGDDNKTEWFDNVEVMQYTGVKDKHGKEICEGDIVSVSTKHHGYEEGEVRLMDGAFGMFYQYIFYPFYENEPIEIIGNIYENSKG
jgi:uncharacterized phage protein (TIGR01671 family)